MNKGDKPIQTRKQAEESILRDMRKILARVHADREKAERGDEEAVNKKHVFSVVNRFIALKRAVKF